MTMIVMMSMIMTKTMMILIVRLHLVMASLVRSSRVLSCSRRSEVWRLATS